MKLSMSISSSKSTVRMYLISDSLGALPSRQVETWAFRRLSESKPLNRVHSTIESPVTTRHCGYSLVDKSTFGRGSSRESNLRRGSTHRAGRRQNPRPSSENDVCG